MADKTTELTNLHPDIVQFQHAILNRYATDNQTAKKGQIVFAGSSSMEIFPIDTLQQNLHLDKVIYNRGVRATTTADLLKHMDTLILDLEPSKIFINIGSNDIGFNVPDAVFLTNYDEILHQVKDRLPGTKVYVMAYYPINPVDDFGEEKEEHKRLYAHRSNELLEAANAKVEQLAQKYGYAFINLNAGLTDVNGNLKKELSFDGAHLLPAAYEIVLENMKKYL